MNNEDTKMFEEDDDDFFMTTTHQKNTKSKYAKVVTQENEESAKGTYKGNGKSK